MEPGTTAERTRSEAQRRPASAGGVVRRLGDYRRTPSRPSTRALLENRRHDSVVRRSLAASDVITMLVALWIAGPLTGGGPMRWLWYALVPGAVLWSKLRGIYDHDTLVLRRSTLDELPQLFERATFFSLLAWLVAGTVAQDDMTRSHVLILWGSLLLLSVVGRSITRELVRRLTPPERCMVMGRRESWTKLDIVLARRRGIEVAAHFNMRSREGGRWEPLDIAVSSARERIRRTVEEEGVHRVIVAATESDEEAILDAIGTLEGLGLKVSVIPHMLEVIGSTGQFEDVEGTAILGVGMFGLSRSSRFIKRAMDVAVAGLGTIFALPLLGAIALAVRLTTPGPIFFRQARIGRDGESFEMLKFRTMYDGSHELRDELGELNETSGLFKIGDDPRITRVGRFLRKTSLDELPQLFNVLRGEMSLVGPRPLVPEEDTKILGWARRRLNLTPGMTGAWQVLGSTRVPLQEMVKIDYLYIATWSLWADIKALLRTVGHVVGRQGL